MKRDLACIICPKSCELTIEEDDGALIVTGYQCKRGVSFAKQEVENPQRILTTTVKLTSGGLLPVRSRSTVKKKEIIELVRSLNSIVVETPVIIGQVIDTCVGEDRVDIIASCNAE
jgi:CxxC motif-containing protein